MSRLTEAGCSRTPALLSHKVEKQSYEEWVPGGYKLYILMAELPGCAPEVLYFSGQMPLQERDSLRRAFKASWLETVQCGLRHTDKGIRNLIWDREGNKWYVPTYHILATSLDTPKFDSSMTATWLTGSTGSPQMKAAFGNTVYILAGILLELARHPITLICLIGFFETSPQTLLVMVLCIGINDLHTS